MNLAETGFMPEAALICLGKLKEFKPRADFAAGVLATAGIQSEWSGECHSLSDVKSFLKRKPYKYYCLCGPDTLYEQMGAQIGIWFKENVPDARLDIAGRLSDEKLSEYGVDGTLYSGQNIYKKLAGLLDSWEDEINA